MCFLEPTVDYPLYTKNGSGGSQMTICCAGLQHWRTCHSRSRSNRNGATSGSVARDLFQETGSKPWQGSSTTETDIEHIVATSEAPDSGLCAADRPTRKRFAQDLRNLILASPQVNRFQKSGKDAADWIADRYRCRITRRVIEVKRASRLTVDPQGQRRSSSFRATASAGTRSPWYAAWRDHHQGGQST